MCGGPSKAEKRAAEAAAEAQREAAEAQREAAEVQRVIAQERKEQEIGERAEAKREDIGQALSSRVERTNRRGGTGRRSLFTSMGGAAGYASRFR
jgi:Skp family chaperone for outer membrane proteins